MNTLIPLLATLFGFASAVVFHQLIELMRKRATDTFIIGPRLWSGVAIDLAFVIVLIASSWLVAVRFRPPRWLSLAIAIVALIVVLALPLMALGVPLLGGLISRLFGPLRFILSEATPGSFLSLQATAILLSVVYAFFRPSQAEPPSGTHAA